jgi:hypothetical protein
VRRKLYVCLSCERRGRKSAPRLCSQTFRIVCQNCGDDPDCIPPIDMLGRVVTVQSKQLYFAPCCAAVREYTATGQDFAARPARRDAGHEGAAQGCQHGVGGHKSAGSSPGYRKPRHTCAAWHCEAHALSKPHNVLDHFECRIETYYLCHKHTPPEDWLRRAKNFTQFSATCRAWEVKVKSSHRK